MTDFLTVLRCDEDGAIAVKTWVFGASEPIGHKTRKWFRQRKEEVSGIYDLDRVLCVIEQRQDELVIRGELKPELDPDDPVRATVKFNKGPPYFDRVPHRWVMFDIDKFPVPEWGNIRNDPEAVVRWIVSQCLPDNFHGIACHWQLSASAGMNDDGLVSLHLWFWVDRLIGSKEWTVWIKSEAPVLDPATVRDVQKHYTGAPVFIEIEDPLPRRSGLLKGDKGDTVEMPHIDVKAVTATLRASGMELPWGFKERLALLGDDKCGFHDVILGATWAAVAGKRRSDIDVEALVAVCMEAVENAVGDRQYMNESEIRRYITEGMDKACLPELTEPTYQAPTASADEARIIVGAAARQFMQDTFDYKRARETIQTQIDDGVADRQLIRATEGQPLKNPFDHMPTLETVQAWMDRAEKIDQGTREAQSRLDELKLPLTLLKGAVGIGKTAELLNVVTDMIASSGLRAAIFVPNHALSGDIVRRVDEKSKGRIDIKVWYGRTYEPTDGSMPMCTRPEAVARAQKLGMKIQTACCQFKAARCPAFESCRYQEQRRASADLWVLPHASLFHAKPDAVGDIDMVIIDETFHEAGLNGPVTLDLEAAREDHDPAAMEEALVAVQVWFSELPDGPVTLDAARTLSFIPAEAERLEWNYLPDPGLTPGSDQHDEAAARGRAAGIKRRRLWELLSRLCGIDGPAVSGEITKVDGKLQLAWREPIRKGWQAPTVVMSATLRQRLVEPYFGSRYAAPRVVEAAAAAPHMKVTQLVGHDMPQSRLIPDPEQGDTENARRTRRAKEVRRYIVTASSGKKTLVICQKGLEELYASWGMPPNIEIAHFNNIAGIDRWGDVDLLVVVGRTQARSSDDARLASVLTGQHHHPAEMVQKARGLQMADGSVVTVGNWVLEDTMLEDVRQSICEDELIQAIGRGRGVNRSAVNPLEVLLLTNICLPVVVHETINEAAVGRVGEMPATGIVLENAAHMALAFPDTWPTHAAAKKWRQGNGKQGLLPVTGSYAVKNSRGQLRRSRFSYDPKVRPDPFSWLKERLEAVEIRLDAKPDYAEILKGDIPLQEKIVLKGEIPLQEYMPL